MCSTAPFEPEFVTAQDEALWMVVPMGVVDKYVKDPETAR